MSAFPSLRLIAEKLRVERGGRAILRDLSFELGAGQAFVVLGRNGAGKSTLLRALAGLLPLRGGALTLEGAGEEPILAEHCHYLGHADGLKLALTAQDNLHFWGEMLGGRDGGLMPREALDKVGLAQIAEFPVGLLSAGQKRRVALARLFVAARPIWLLDEPANALDVSAQKDFALSMAEHRARGGMILAATHAELGLSDARHLRLEPKPPKGERAE